MSSTSFHHCIRMSPIAISDARSATRASCTSATTRHKRMLVAQILRSRARLWRKALRSRGHHPSWPSDRRFTSLLNARRTTNAWRCSAGTNPRDRKLAMSDFLPVQHALRASQECSPYGRTGGVQRSASRECPSFGNPSTMPRSFCATSAMQARRPLPACPRVCPHLYPSRTQSSSTSTVQPSNFEQAGGESKIPGRTFPCTGRQATGKVGLR